MANRYSAQNNAINQSLANILGANVGGFTGSRGLSPDEIIRLKMQLGIA